MDARWRWSYGWTTMAGQVPPGMTGRLQLLIRYGGSSEFDMQSLKMIREPL